jgi:hypothetical protein
MIAFTHSSQCQNAATQANQFSVNIDNPSVACNNSTEPDCFAGWTLPTAGDLQVLMANLDTVNASIAEDGGTPLSGTYWSSSQSPGDANQAYEIIATKDALPTTAGVTTMNHVRLVRYF